MSLVMTFHFNMKTLTIIFALALTGCSALTDRLSEYEEAEPTMSGTSPTSKQVAGQSNKDASFADSIEAAFASI